MEKPTRITAEDLLRETSRMLPQSGNARALPEELLEPYAKAPGFPSEDARFLLNTVSFSEPIPT